MTDHDESYDNLASRLRREVEGREPVPSLDRTTAIQRGRRALLRRRAGASIGVLAAFGMAVAGLSVIGPGIGSEGHNGGATTVRVAAPPSRHSSASDFGTVMDQRIRADLPNGEDLELSRVEPMRENWAALPPDQADKAAGWRAIYEIGSSAHRQQLIVETSHVESLAVSGFCRDLDEPFVADHEQCGYLNAPDGTPAARVVYDPNPPRCTWWTMAIYVGARDKGLWFRIELLSYADTLDQALAEYAYTAKQLAVIATDPKIDFPPPDDNGGPGGGNR